MSMYLVLEDTLLTWTENVCASRWVGKSPSIVLPDHNIWSRKLGVAFGCVHFSLKYWWTRATLWSHCCLWQPTSNWLFSKPLAASQNNFLNSCWVHYILLPLFCHCLQINKISGLYCNVLFFHFLLFADITIHTTWNWGGISPVPAWRHHRRCCSTSKYSLLIIVFVHNHWKISDYIVWIGCMHMIIASINRSINQEMLVWLMAYIHYHDSVVYRYPTLPYLC